MGSLETRRFVRYGESVVCGNWNTTMKINFSMYLCIALMPSQGKGFNLKKSTLKLSKIKLSLFSKLTDNYNKAYSSRQLLLPRNRTKGSRTLVFLSDMLYWFYGGGCCNKNVYVIYLVEHQKQSIDGDGV